VALFNALSGGSMRLWRSARSALSSESPLLNRAEGALSTFSTAQRASPLDPQGRFRSKAEKEPRHRRILNFLNCPKGLSTAP